MELRQLHEGTSLSNNIEEHAGAPLYPKNAKHPHPKYQDCNRLIITPLDPQMRRWHKIWEMRAKIDPTLDDHRNFLDDYKIADLDCDCRPKILFEKVLNPSEYTDEAMAYNSCKHTIVAAAKRQMKMAPTPDPAVADDFLEYSKRIIDKEVGESLRHFGYSYQDWYHHLTSAKQHDMDLYCRYRDTPQLLTHEELHIVQRQEYEGICKVEIEPIDGKPRMVCSLPLETKFTMGPITWQLEEIFQDQLQGYCGGQNLTQMGDKLNHYINLGFTKVVSGDGSAFDNTQDITLKRVDHYIYETVAPHVHHVPREQFLRIATNPYKTMKISYVNRHTKKMVDVLRYRILGTVFSGDTDTTLCNTIRMALYNRYVNDKAGLEYGVDYVVLSKGDDFTVLYKSHISDAFITNAYYKYFLKANPDKTAPETRIYGLGQVLKMLNFGLPNSFVFCSLRSWYLSPDGNEILLTRDPAKLFTLGKYSRKTKVYNVAQRIKYLNEQAEQLMANYPQLTIFQIAACAYRKQAQQLFNGHPAKHILVKQLDRLKRAEKRKQYYYETHQDRKSKSEYMPHEDDDFKRFYETHHRRVTYQIRDSYWETMKRIEKIQVKILTREQADYVNQQMKAEFHTEELKSLLGLKINES